MFQDCNICYIITAKMVSKQMGIEDSLKKWDTEDNLIIFQLDINRNKIIYIDSKIILS